MSTQAPGKTALISGASSGLGAEYARQLAAMGYHLILTARRTERLQHLADSLHSNYGTIPQVQPADLSKISDVENLISTISNLDTFDLLVNNAGFGTVGRFHHVDPLKELSMLNVHMLAPVMLCRAALPGMISRNQGVIINVASLAGLIPIRNVLYHSTKSFLISFSEALYNELRGSAVQIQVLCPRFIVTEFHETIEYTRFSRRGIPKFLWMSPEQVVSTSVSALSTKKLICIPGEIYRFAGVLARNSITAGLIKMIAGTILHKRKPIHH